MKKRTIWLAIAVAFTVLFLSGTAGSAQTVPSQIKELNFVLLHGAGSNSSVMQPLMDAMTDKLPAYIAQYEKDNPGTEVHADFLNRSYPNAVSIESWAGNIAESINKYFTPQNLILVGHSMGGKSALYTTAHDIGNLQDKIAAIVTINSPVKPLSSYYFPGGADYWSAAWLVRQDRGIVSSLARYDSSPDGDWVGANKHWLALTSAESSPLSTQFDVNGVDPLPRDMDDTIVPISAQYTPGADTVYYGQHSHSEFSEQPILAGILADYILKYVFGGTIQYAVQSVSGGFNHEAGWMPVSYQFGESTGEFPINSGSVTYYNPSFFKWQEWTVTVGDESFYGKRSYFKLNVHSLPLISGLIESDWLNSNETDSRVAFRIRAAPRTHVIVDWSTVGYAELSGVYRDHYEVEIATGTPFTGIGTVSWSGLMPGDLRLKINSSAEGPLRWFEARWRIYIYELRDIRVIDDIPVAAGPVS